MMTTLLLAVHLAATEPPANDRAAHLLVEAKFEDNLRLSWSPVSGAA